jgi:hypothetical protein
MSTGTIRPLSWFRVDFSELYTRHLGRHSQFGINIAHLAALYGIWFGIYGAIDQTLLHAEPRAAWPVIIAMAVTYLAMVSVNAPIRVTLATATFLVVFVASVLALPTLPAWSILVFVALVPLFYKVQAYSHKVWNKAADMSEFNRRFPPGRALSFLLLINEVPICLNYLAFRRDDWRA